MSRPMSASSIHIEMPSHNVSAFAMLSRTSSTIVPPPFLARASGSVIIGFPFAAR
jgi:hypothetical protein